MIEMARFMAAGGRDRFSAAILDAGAYGRRIRVGSGVVCKC
jgi:hypothetical protein